MAARDAGHVVDRKGEIGGQIGKARIADHLLRARSVLLGGLEHQDDGAPRRALAAQQPRHGGQHRHMAVMSALMALPGNG